MRRYQTAWRYKAVKILAHSKTQQASQPASQPASKPASQAASQPESQAISQSTSQPASQAGSLSARQRTSQSASQSSQQTRQLTSEPAPKIQKNNQTKIRKLQHKQQSQNPQKATNTNLWICASGFPRRPQVTIPRLFWWFGMFCFWGTMVFCCFGNYAILFERNPPNNQTSRNPPKSKRTTKLAL